MSKSSLALCVLGAALVATAAPAHAGNGTDLLKFVPEQSQLVMVFDMGGARGSGLLQKGFSQLLAAAPDAKTKLAELGLDPMKDIDTILFAGGSAKGLSKDSMQDVLIIVEGRLPKDKLSTIPDATSSTYAGVTIFTSKDTDAAFIGDRMYFAKKGKLKAEIDLVLGKGKAKGKSVATSKRAKAMKAAIAAADTKAHLWAAVLIPASAQADMKKEGMAASTVTFGMKFTADLAIGLKLVTDSADSAAKIVGMAQAQLGQVTSAASSMGLTKAAKSLMVAADGPVVKLNLALTEAELTSIMNLAKQFGGMAAKGAAGNP
ncbi:MAG: hypothetical protein R3B06_06780 [Kofleriaceae bacterium]